MHNSQESIFRGKSWLKKTAPIISVVGISTLISLPALSQVQYPPMVFFQPLAYPSYPQRNGIGDLINSLEDDPNYENLIYELKESGLVEELKQDELTLIAPNDQAFNALSEEAFDKFSDPETRIKVLQYHLVEGKVTKEDIQRGEITTLAGETIAISNQENLQLNDANVIFPSTVTDNGVIINVDQVLLPPSF